MSDISLEAIRLINLKNRELKKEIEKLKKEKELIAQYIEQKREALVLKIEMNKINTDIKNIVFEQLYASEYFRDVDKFTIKELSIEDLYAYEAIIKSICNDSEYVKHNIFSGCRKDEVVILRHIIRYYLHNDFEVKLPLKKIAYLTGSTKGDHSTVLHSINYVENINIYDKRRLSIKLSALEKMKYAEISARRVYRNNDVQPPAETRKDS